MKKKKLFSLFVAACMGAAVFAGCADNSGGGNGDGGGNGGDDTTPSVTQLAAPQISLSENVISWSAVANADGYTVYQGDTIADTVTATSYTISISDPGSYTFAVVATSNDEKYSDSEKSNTVTYTVEAATDPDPEELPETTVYFVGDSTVCSFSDAYYLPRYGYGTQFENFVSDKVTVSNLALSGRSSYSFLSEDNYDTLVNSIGEGDYLIIGFGHNDEKAETERYTNPNLPYTDSTTLINGRPASFAYTLYNYYIKVAEDAGATPILCTPIVRANSSDNYEGSSAHITETATVGDIEFAGGDYAKAIRDLGAATDTTVVDLTAITKADYTALGYDKAVDYHAWTATKNGVRSGVDTTHTNMYGAKMNAYHIASELAKSDNPLGDYVLGDIVKPTYEADYAAGINPDYKEPDYAPFDPATDKSTIWTGITKEGWYGTVMGDVGGKDKISASEFTVSQTGDSFTVGNHSSTNRGKIASGSDGFAAVFMQLEANRNFEITVTVTLDKYKDSNNQTGFGLMLRDDIFIDEHSSAINSNYVSAGMYYTSGAAQILYSREGTSLKKSGNTATIAEGGTYTLKITKDNQTVHTYFTIDETTYEETYTDFDFVAVDNENVYVCLYATRGTVATFSNIQYVDKGLGVDA